MNRFSILKYLLPAFLLCQTATAANAQQTKGASDPDDIELRPNLILNRADFQAEVTKLIGKFTQGLEFLYGDNDIKAEARERKEMLKTIFNNNKSVVIEVKNKNDIAPRPYSVEKYLIRVSGMKFSTVSVTSSVVHFITQMTKHYDSVTNKEHFTASCIVLQYFRGEYGEMHTNYSDTTRKRMELDIEISWKVKNGHKVPNWDIFLGDIKISEEQ